MSDVIILMAIVIVVSLVLAMALLRLWRRVMPVDAAVPPVQVLGLYSPVLTWLKGRGITARPPRLASPKADMLPAESGLRTENERLKQRVKDLEAQVAVLTSAALVQPQPVWNTTRLRAERVPLLRLAGSLALAAVPSWLIVDHYWFNHEQLSNQMRAGWCSVDFLCRMNWPGYFGVVLACAVGVLALVLAERRPLTGLWNAVGQPSAASTAPDLSQQRRLSRGLLVVAGLGLLVTAATALAGGRQPTVNYALFLAVYAAAWVVWQVPLAAVVNWWRTQHALVLAVALAHVALIGVLAAYYGTRSLLGAMVLLLVVAVANLARFRARLHPIFWIISAALVVYTLRIDAWWFSVVGDEYSFFSYAREIVTGETSGSFGQNFFSGTAVYGAHPYLSSVLQALSMKLLGMNNFGWRFSSLYLSALSIGLFYAFGRTFVQRRVALLAAGLLAVSHYVMAFGKIGYNNLQALFALGLVLAAAAWVIRTRQLLAYAGLGLAMGLCFYVYPAALYALPLPVLLLWLYDRPLTMAAWRAWGLTGLTALLVLIPLLLQPGYWEAKVMGTLFFNPDLTRSLSAVVNHFATNWLYAFFSFWYVPGASHFVSVAYVDPLSALFVLIGLGCLLRQARRERFALFLVVSFGLMLFLVGATHDRLYPSTTRMFMLLPWWTLLAAVGLVWLQRGLVGLGAGRIAWMGVLGTVLVGIVAINLHLAYGLAYQQALARGGLENLYLRLAQDVQAVEGNRPKTFVFVTDPEWGIDGLYLLQLAYGTPTSPTQLEKITVEQPLLSEAALARLADVDTLIILKPWLPADWQIALGDQLTGLGKRGCPVTRAGQGKAVFVLWHAPALASLCP